MKAFFFCLRIVCLIWSCLVLKALLSNRSRLHKKHFETCLVCLTGDLDGILNRVSLGSFTCGGTTSTGS